ncbi:hypothetical protein KBD33_01980 [Candidatus Gracilibacteria bacterium]|nr:hypothetical protein [Candidatus Gracilibacteria bacterium]
MSINLIDSTDEYVLGDHARENLVVSISRPNTCPNDWNAVKSFRGGLYGDGDIILQVVPLGGKCSEFNGDLCSLTQGKCVMLLNQVLVLSQGHGKHELSFLPGGI